MYNKETARKNQKNFLLAQMNCGYKNIEVAARRAYERMIIQEQEQKRIDEIVKSI